MYLTWSHLLWYTLTDMSSSPFFLFFYLLLNCILLRLNRFQACCFQLRSSNDCINQALHCTGLIPRKIDLFCFFLSLFSHHKYQPLSSLFHHPGRVRTCQGIQTSQGQQKLSYWLKFSFICLLHWLRLVLTRRKCCTFTFNFVGCDILATILC